MCFVQSKIFLKTFCCLVYIFFLSSPVAGHPKILKAAVFDIISPDLQYGAVAAGAEIIAVASDCLDSFPNLAQNYDIHISHSKCESVVFKDFILFSIY
jgi:hypothetical protein